MRLPPFFCPRWAERMPLCSLTTRRTGWPSSSPSSTPLADKVLDHAHGLKIELLKFTDDDGAADLLISYEIHGSLPEDQTNVLTALINRLAGKAGAK